MSMIDRSLDGMAALSGHLGVALRRRLRELVGIALISVAMMAGLALASWSVQDPSLSHATDAPVHNLLGVPGAIAADLMMQLLGLGSVALLLPVAVWGYRLLGHRRLSHERLRVLVWMLGAVLSAAFVSCLPRTVHWPLPSGLGGVVGDAMLRLPLVLFHIQLVGTTRLVFAVGLGFAALVAFGTAAGMIFGGEAEDYDDYEAEDEEEADGDDDREAGDSAWISLGFIEHHLLSFRAWLGRLFLRRERMPLASRDNPAIPRRRVEPRFENAARGAADDTEDDGDEDDEESAPRVRKPRAAKIRRSSSGFLVPSLNLLAAPRASERSTLSSDEIQENATRLEGVLGDFGVRGEIINARPGPVVTLYELELAPGIKSSRVISLADDIARSMSALSARVAVVSGRNAIGIELPNPVREKVYLRELLASREYVETSFRLPLCLGKSIGGESIMVDLARMPHLLIAGTTGSGKSVAINTMILSLLYRLHPDQCRLIMIDPKMLELSVYDGIPHLLAPVVTEPRKAIVALKWAVREMEERYRKMSKLGVRGVEAFNDRVAKAKAKGESLKRTVQTGFDRETGKPIYEDEVLELEHMPFIVVVVDEVADLMMVSGKEIEGAVQRLAQMARAAGIHLIAATQRPSVDVITGKIDSRTILGEQGAEQLLGQGDMLYMMAGGRIRRIHGPFVKDIEVEDVVRFLKTQGQPEYLDAVTEEPDEETDDPYALMGGGAGGGNSGSGDDLYE